MEPIRLRINFCEALGITIYFVCQQFIRIRLMDYNNGFSLSSFFLSLLSFLWIGAQFPQEKFLSYGRILTLDYYFLLMCILFSNLKVLVNV